MSVSGPLRFTCLRPRYGRAAAAFNMLLLLVTLSLAPVSADAAGKRIVMLGDSITAGYGLPAADALPLLVQQNLQTAGIEAEVENAGVSGDTAAGGLARLDWAIQGTPDLVVVALGGNDGLRGFDPADTRANLTAIVEKLRSKGVRVLLAGMLAPPNMGPDYAADFNRIFADIAEQQDVALYPFLLDGVAADPVFNQADGIHPNAKGARIVASRLAEAMIPLLSP